MRGHAVADRLWYGDSAWALVLLPLSLVYRALIGIRKKLFDAGLLRSGRANVPVIVVGNISVGGTGKTPVCIWLVAALQARGFKPGVVSRGYRGRIGHSPLPVLAHSDPAVVGDEPVLIAERCRCPVVVHPERLSAAALLEEQGVDVIVADDGLQHYRLQRDVELAVVDGSRGFGNGHLLPAGPLREPVSRLRRADRVLVNVADGEQPAAAFDAANLATSRFRLEARGATRLADGEERPLSSFQGTKVHAVAAIGNPRRFFDLLSSAGMTVIPHAHADHAPLLRSDLEFDDGLRVMITEKDAVKCRQVDAGDVWYVPVDAVFDDEGWLDELQQRIVRTDGGTDA